MSEGLLDGCRTGSILGRDDAPRKERAPVGPPEPQEPMVPLLLALPVSELNRLAMKASEEDTSLEDLLHRRLSGVGIRQATIGTSAESWCPHCLSEMLVATVCDEATRLAMAHPTMELRELMDSCRELLISAAVECHDRLQRELR